MEYEIYENGAGQEYIKGTREDGSVIFIPNDPSNSDYQAYLNPVEHSTEILPSEANTK